MAENEFELKDSGAREQFDTGAKRDTQESKPRPDLISPFSIERLAWVFARGAEKYDEHNWMKGIPFSRCLASAERHLMQFKQGDTDEDHLAQAVWNLMAILHYQEVGPEGLDDLPKYERLAKKQEPAIPGAYAEVAYVTAAGDLPIAPISDELKSELRGH